MRAPLVHDRKTRCVLLVAAAALLALAATTCTVRIARLWSSPINAIPGPPPQWSHHRIMIEHGVLVLETYRNGSTPPPIYPITNWQIDPGISTTTFLIEIHNGPPGVVPATSAVRRTYGVAFFLCIGSVICILPLMPLRRVPPGECICGYPTTGVSGGACPECGRSLRASNEAADA